MLAPFTNTPTFLRHELEFQKRNLDLAISNKYRPAVVFVTSEHFELVEHSPAAPPEWYLARQRFCWAFIEKHECSVIHSAQSERTSERLTVSWGEEFTADSSSQQA